MALNAGETSAQHHFPGCIDTIDHRCGTELLIICPTLVVGHRIPMEGRGNQLFICSSGEQIPGHLFGQKSVIGLVFVETFDQIITVAPYVPRVVPLITLRVSIPRQVHPRRSPTFAISTRCKQAVNESLVRVGTLVPYKGLDPFRRKWQTGQVKRYSPRECPPVSLR